MSDATREATPDHDPNTPARLRRLWADAHQRRLRLRVERANVQGNLAAWQQQAAQREADGRPPSQGLTAWMARARARLDELGEELPAAEEQLRATDEALRALHQRA